MENVQEVSASISVSLCYRHIHSCQLAVISLFVCYSTLRELRRICLELAEFRSCWLSLFCRIGFGYNNNLSILVYFARPNDEFYTFQYFSFNPTIVHLGHKQPSFIFICWIPSWRWPKKAETCRRTTTCLYSIASNFSAAVGVEYIWGVIDLSDLEKFCTRPCLGPVIFCTDIVFGPYEFVSVFCLLV
jgi:hypothetical protein